MEHGPSADYPGTAHIGCAGWNQISGVPPFSQMAGSQLERYASVFPAVEINSSFYRPHRHSTYERWAASVPRTFRFSVKLPRTITHALRLARTDALLAQFRGETAGLGDKLGCVLVQLPPSLQLEPAVADRFFAQLRAAFPCMLACEARHPSWFGPDAHSLLHSHAITRVIADPPKGQDGPHEPTTPELYVRLHGSPRIYHSSYPDDCLAQWAGAVAAQVQTGCAAWLVFDNTASGAALRNALAVLTTLAQRSCDKALAYAP